MHDERLRQLIHAAADECLTGVDALPSRERDIIRQIKGEKTTVKKRISMALVLAIAATLALAGTAVAAGLGLFGHFADRDQGGWASGKLAHLETVATAIGETARVQAYPSGIGIGSTTRDSILTSWDGAEFALTLDQAYCDGQKLYYSYTLETTGPTARILGQGEPTGIEKWDAEYPGETFESSGIHLGERDDEAVRTFFAEEGAKGKTAYAVVNHFCLGDGADMMDGTPAMIYDSAEEFAQERTIRGYQEVELPEGTGTGDTLEFTLAVGYGATIFMQDETGLYSTPIFAQESRGWIDVPFTVPVDPDAVRMTGEGEVGGYPAEASLTFSGAEAYGEALIEAPDAWLEAIQNEDGDGSAVDRITSFALVAGGARLENLDLGYGPASDGRFRVILRFDLPQERESLVLYPVYEDAGLDMGEGIALH